MRQWLVSRAAVMLLASVVAITLTAAAPKAGKTAAKKGTAKAKPAAKATAAQIAAGKATFDRMCLACHKIDGKGGASGPDLSHVGGQRDAAFLTQKLKDPKASNPKSIMPKFAGSPAELANVVAYLSSLK